MRLTLAFAFKHFVWGKSGEKAIAVPMLGLMVFFDFSAPRLLARFVSEIAATMIKRNRPRIETSSLCNVDCTKIDHKFNLGHMIAIIFAVIQHC